MTSRFGYLLYLLSLSLTSPSRAVLSPWPRSLCARLSAVHHGDERCGHVRNGWQELRRHRLRHTPRCASTNRYVCVQKEPKMHCQCCAFSATLGRQEWAAYISRWLPLLAVVDVAHGLSSASQMLLTMSLLSWVDVRTYSVVQLFQNIPHGQPTDGWHAWTGHRRDDSVRTLILARVCESSVCLQTCTLVGASTRCRDGLLSMAVPSWRAGPKNCSSRSTYTNCERSATSSHKRS